MPELSKPEEVKTTSSTPISGEDAQNLNMLIPATLIGILAALPVGFAAGQIPNVTRRRLFKLIVGLAVVGAVIPRLAEHQRERPQPLRQRGRATHVMGADAVLIHPGDDGRSTRGADAGSRVRVDIADTLLGQPVQVRRDRVGVTEASQVGADVLARNPQDIRSSIITRRDGGSTSISTSAILGGSMTCTEIHSIVSSSPPTARNRNE